jgi:hypothetical protein
MRRLIIFISCIIFFAFTSNIVQAGNVMMDTTVDGLRIELHVLPAEPFLTKNEVSAGKGDQSTHYGNNVVMPDGKYVVVVVVNGKKLSFKINLTETLDATMKGMQMH